MTRFRHVELVTNSSLAEELAVELALTADVDVQVVPPPERGHDGAGGSLAMDVSDIQTLIVTISTTATAVLTLASAIIGLLHSHNQAAGSERGSVVVTGDHAVVILGDEPGAAERLAQVLELSDRSQIRLQRQPGS